MSTTLRFAELKAAARASFVTAEDAVSGVSAARAAADTHHLRLQNLLYEKNLLEREIKRCEDFATTEMDKVNLVSKAEFQKSAGKELTGVSESSDPHRYHMNRLTFELNERKK